MLTIRSPQLAAMTPELEAFTATLCATLARAWPQRFVSRRAPDLLAFVERTIAVALAHDIHEQRGVSTFAHLRVAYGEQFERTPVADEALALLHDAALPGAIKIAAIAQCLRDATGGRPVILVPEPGE